MFLKRAITAAVAIPVLVFYITYGGETAFFFLILLVAGLSLHEFFTVALPHQSFAEKTVTIFLGLLIISSVFTEIWMLSEKKYLSYFLVTGSFALNFFLLFLFSIITAGQFIKVFDQILVKIFGIFYIALFCSYFLLIRSLNNGLSLIFLLLFVTWAGDSGAYAVGVWMGRHPLCPGISPKKTIEGAVGGFIIGVLTSVLCRMFFLKEISILHFIILGSGINIMNQFGDLSESLIKRALGIKESGRILPGHGGLLDRIDSLLFAAPFLFYYARFFFSQ